MHQWVVPELVEDNDAAGEKRRHERERAAGEHEDFGPSKMRPGLLQWPVEPQNGAELLEVSGHETLRVPEWRGTEDHKFCSRVDPPDATEDLQRVPIRLQPQYAPRADRKLIRVPAAEVHSDSKTRSRLGPQRSCRRAYRATKLQPKPWMEQRAHGLGRRVQLEKQVDCVDIIRRVRPRTTTFDLGRQVRRSGQPDRLSGQLLQRFWKADEPGQFQVLVPWRERPDVLQTTLACQCLGEEHVQDDGPHAISLRAVTQAAAAVCGLDAR
mmetsp:Transcript_21112/g.59019  ORF Transcript_21112/g.59019 Transcript_21112/m.59019 type:complete len:268 (+) Transcript_21112:148-951(+)